MVNKFIVIFFVLIFFSNSSLAESQASPIDELFHIGQMNSHNKKFSLYFKTREKAVLARGEDFNYVQSFLKICISITINKNFFSINYL